jgi:hypothetical protein
MPIRDEKRRASVLDEAFNYAVEQQIDLSMSNGFSRFY